MDDSELNTIRQRKLRDLQRRLAVQTDVKRGENEADEAYKVLNPVFKGRAWEVFNSAKNQFPRIMGKIEDALVKLAKLGRLKEVNGEQLYFFLRSLGLKVSLETKIRFSENGKLKSLTEKLKETL